MVETVTLQNGVRVVMERMENIRSLSIGVWVNTGSVREKEQEAGASHFIEHMVFKGTERRSASEIAAEMDSIGGTLNAFTSKECTCFYARVLDKHLNLAVDVLSDIVLHSRFDPEELEREKKVVIEEILMNEDSPEDVSAEEAGRLFFGDDPLALPILGTQESVSAFDREGLLSYFQEHYVTQNTVVACAGHFDRDQLLNALSKGFDMAPSEKKNQPLTQGFPGGRRISCIKKDIEQVHITLALPGYGRDTREQYALAVLSNALGGSMSSRLFQSIREKQGLAYSVYSYPIFYSDTGIFSLYAGTGEKQAETVLSLMLKEIREIRENGLTKEEFIRCREQLLGSYLLGMESSSAWMNAIGKVALLQNRAYNEKETLDRIAGVTMEDVERTVAYALNEENLVAALVGRVGPHEEKFREILAGR